LLCGRSIETDTSARLARAAAYDVHVDETGDPDFILKLADEDCAIALLYHDLDREFHCSRQRWLPIRSTLVLLAVRKHMIDAGWLYSNVVMTITKSHG
jgi:hypothetical protein